jgi:hypothetical protein
MDAWRLSADAAWSFLLRAIALFAAEHPLRRWLPVDDAPQNTAVDVSTPVKAFAIAGSPQD